MNDLIGKITQGDCLDVMKGMPDNSVDLVLTDPPYNAKDIGPNKRTYENHEVLTKENYIIFCKNWSKEALRVGKRLVFTSGIVNICYYTQPDWVLCWHKPAAVSFNRYGGYNAWEPILLYGKRVKHLGQDFKVIHTLNFSKGLEAQHPCPKPIKLWTYLVDQFSNGNDLILDPFSGSGTTAIACHQLKRRFICVEKEPNYVELSRQRLLDAQNQMELF